MLYSYHVHSKWSDGETDITDMVKAAVRMGLDEIGISDHYCLPADGSKLFWCMSPDAIEDYVIAVQSAAAEGGESTIVRLGLEADFVPETANALREVLASYPFDYVIGSVHIVDGFPVDNEPSDWERLSPKERDDIHRGYWIRVRQMAESGLYDFAGHLDLPKKFAFYPSIDLNAEVNAALDAIARSKMAAEVNTSGWFKPCAQEYPSPDIIQGCFERGIPMLVTADAHTPEDLTRAFPRAFRLLRDAGYSTVVSFAGREKFVQPLPDIQ